MRGTVCILLVAAGFLLRGGEAVHEPVLFQGRPYQAVGDWAEGTGMRWGWEKPQETLWVTNRWVRMQFAVDSRRAVYNGIAVWLSEPVGKRNGDAYLATVDLETLFEVLLHPPRLEAGRKIRRVCLDPGHGGRDPGNQEGKYQEKHYTLLLARELRDMLQAAGLQVSMTRTADRLVELPERPALADQRGADLLVSLHFNAAADREAGRGAEVYCLTPARTSSTNAGGAGADTGPLPGNEFNDESLTLAYQIQKAMVDGLGVEDRGVRRARFAVLRTCSMPAVLVESAFMSHPEDLKRIVEGAGRKRIARAIADGILATKRLLERGGGGASSGSKP